MADFLSTRIRFSESKPIDLERSSLFVVLLLLWIEDGEEHRFAIEVPVNDFNGESHTIRGFYGAKILQKRVQPVADKGLSQSAFSSSCNQGGLWVNLTEEEAELFDTKNWFSNEVSGTDIAS